MKRSAKKNAARKARIVTPTAKSVENAVPALSQHPKKAEVKITTAKGRPMLTWVGKRPLSHITAFPAQHIETFDPTDSFRSNSGNPDLWKSRPPFG